MASNTQLSRTSGDLMTNPTLYRSTVGALQYATITRPDICFSVNKVSQFMQNPSNTHWQAVKRILRYLKGTIHYGLTLSISENINLSGYADTDWGSDPDDRRSTSGYCIFLGKNPISWC